MDSPADTESGAYHSAISFPGTPPFYFRGNESEETITTGGFRRKSNMVEELSIIASAFMFRFMPVGHPSESSS